MGKLKKGIRGRQKKAKIAREKDAGKTPKKGIG